MMQSENPNREPRRSVNTEGFAHVNPVPVASRIGRHLQSGVLTGRDLETRQFPESLDEQVRIVFERIAELMVAAGGSPADILKINLWVERYRDRDAINREWTAMFPDPGSRPARQIIKAQLDEGALIQADVVAVLPDAKAVVEPVETTAPERPAVSTSSIAEGTVVAPRAGDEAPVAQRVEAEPVPPVDPTVVATVPTADPVLTPELRATLASTPVSTLSTALRKRGHIDIFIEGVATNQPGVRIVGTARTLRLIPYRPDLFAERGGGFNAQKQAFDSINAGEILVVEARGERGTGTVGDILALRAKVRGAAGIITDGGVRDWAQVKEIGIPVFSQGPHPSVLGRRHVPWETQIVVACGGVAIVPGDVIVADDDGAIVIPAALVAEVAAEAAAQELEDAWVAKRVAAGEPVEGLFPPNADNKARFEADLAAGAFGATPAQSSPSDEA